MERKSVGRAVEAPNSPEKWYPLRLFPPWNKLQVQSGLHFYSFTFFNLSVPLSVINRG